TTSEHNEARTSRGNSNSVGALDQGSGSGLPHPRDQGAKDDSLDESPELLRRTLLDYLVEGARVSETEPLELQLVKSGVPVGLHGREDITDEEVSHFSRQMTLVCAGTNVDGARQPLGEVNEASGYLDLIVEKVPLYLSEAGKHGNDGLSEADEQGGDVERVRNFLNCLFGVWNAK